MAKKFFRSFLVGLIVFAVAVLAGYLSYVWTYRYQSQKLQESLHAQDHAFAAPVYREAAPLSSSGILDAEYYIARLENNNIAIYTSQDGRESFLYTLHIYTEDLPESDRTRLLEGVVLRTRQELASFEEDYNS